MDVFILKGCLEITKSLSGRVHPKGCLEIIKSLGRWTHPKDTLKLLNPSGRAHPSERVHPEDNLKIHVDEYNQTERFILRIP